MRVVRRDWILLKRQMKQRLGMRGVEAETALKSSGTTVYYQDSSWDSAQASEPVGGRCRRTDTEVMGLTELKTETTVMQHETAAGTKGHVRAVRGCRMGDRMWDHSCFPTHHRLVL